MEVEKRKGETEKTDNDIVFSRAIKAGKRIYYLDVKKNKYDEMFLAITESKKKFQGFEENTKVTYEKHKIFLYQEDFEKFNTGLSEVMAFIKSASPETSGHKAEPDEAPAPQEQPKRRFFNKFRFK